MKRLFLFLMMFAACFTMANAQDKAGVTTIYPRVGLCLSKYSGDKLYYGFEMDDYVNARMKSGFTAGVEVEHMFTDIFGASAGIIFAQQGTKYEELPEEEFEHLSIDLNYINIPVLFVASTNIGINIKAGIQPGIRLGDKFNQVMDRVYFSIPLGVSYDIGQFSLDVRYNLGISKVWKGDGKIRNNTIMLTLGYGIEL